jgi:hypothetical protein
MVIPWDEHGMGMGFREQYAQRISGVQCSRIQRRERGGE